jgi:oxygen-independent coproporphyrinogen-3 oxidase
MAGIYVHVPFCKQACHYCNFHFSTSLNSQNDFIGALLKEIGLQKEYIGSEKVETIYFGGGTPSLLPATGIQEILERIREIFIVDDQAELTLEANPDDINQSILQDWKHGGFNRLSIGIQSFFDEDLRWMNRAHNAKDAEAGILMAREAGFSNISIDLIYGGPTLDNEHWKKNVDKALSFDIPHFSCYALTVEPKTPLYKMIRSKKVPDTDPDQQATQFLLLMKWMEAAGYEHYEISNFAKPGFRSRHNSSYWQGKKYLGLGPSAHSYDGLSRQWNVSNNNLYIRSLAKNELIFEKENLTTTQVLNEYIMTSLRTMEGIDLSSVSEKFGSVVSDTIRLKAAGYIGDLKLKENNQALMLTNEGKLLADGIAAGLFFDRGLKD